LENETGQIETVEWGKERQRWQRPLPKIWRRAITDILQGLPETTQQDDFKEAACLTVPSVDYALHPSAYFKRSSILTAGICSVLVIW